MVIRRKRFSIRKPNVGLLGREMRPDLMLIIHLFVSIDVVAAGELIIIPLVPIVDPFSILVS